MRAQVKLGFATLGAAKAYAERSGLADHVTPGTAARSLKIQTFVENYKGPEI